MTSHDVARLAGVAQSTVSNALSGKGSVSARTRERVLAAAAELRYRPNLAARSMRTQRTGRLAVVMGIPLYNPSLMLAGAGAAAAEAGYAMEVHSIDGGIETRSERALELAESGQYEGVLSFFPVLREVEHGGPQAVPVVVPADFTSELHGAGAVADPSPVAELIERLAALGHRRFLHIAGPDHYASAAGRKSVYLATVARLGLESLGVVGGDWTADIGVEAMRSLPADAPPLAVIAANDLVAVGVMRGAAERGWTVPGDVSVTGWDDYDVGPYLTPSLTTVNVDRAEAGRREMQRLVAILRHEAPPQDLPTLNTVIWRESTAPPGSPRRSSGSGSGGAG